MSRPDSTGESLESILASIRRSLSEQSTDVLDEETAAPADTQGDAGSPVPHQDGLTLAAGTAEPPQIDQAKAAEQGVAVEEPPPSAAPPSPAAPAAARAQKDPLWFLSGRGQPAAKGSDAVADTSRAASADGKPPTGEPKASQPGVVRGPLPPFFGSSAEAQKAEVVLVQPSPSGAGVMPPPVAQPLKVPLGHAGAPQTAGEMPRAPVADAGGRAPEAARNGRANSLFGHAAADGRTGPGGDTPHIHALEAMVAELLRPMLRQWLEENMPRLVSTALKEEAARMAERDAKKS